MQDTENTSSAEPFFPGDQRSRFSQGFIRFHQVAQNSGTESAKLRLFRVHGAARLLTLGLWVNRVV